MKCMASGGSGRKGHVTAWRRSALVLLWFAAFAASAAETVRMGFLQGGRRDLTVAELHGSFELWAAELEARFQVPVKVTFFENVARLRAALQSGEINGVSGDGMMLARNFKLEELAQGYAVAMPGGANLVLLPGRDAAVGSVRDLAGKRVVLVNDDQTAALFLENLCLRGYARDCRRVFSSVQLVSSNNRALLNVFFGQADLALVNRYGYELSKELNPQLERKIGDAIAELRVSSQYYAFFRANVDQEFRRRVLSVVPTLHTYPRGRQLLDMLKMDHLDLADPSELKPLLQLDREYRELKSQVRGGKGRP